MSDTAQATQVARPSFITTADERLARAPKTNMVITGASDAGKTTLARTLPPEETLFVDLEAGTKALADWRGDVIDVRQVATKLGVHPWELARALACVMCGPDPAADPNDVANPYSKVNYDNYCTAVGGPDAFAKYKYVFWDSVTVAARHCFGWCQTQPEAFSDRTGKPDTRGAYGLHGRELVRWLTTIQHIKDKSTIVVCILNQETDDLRRVTYTLQIDGGKAKAELPGIFDNIATLSRFKTTDGVEYRALVCQGANEWGYPAKDRSGALDVLEPPDLLHIIKKSSTGPRLNDLARTVPADFTAESVTRRQDGPPGDAAEGITPTGTGAFNPNKTAA